MKDYQLTTLSGEPTTLSSFQGKVLLIVNVASQCGFTKQYEGLEALYREYKDQGLVILGFPANDFAAQEPGTSAEIGAFCDSKFGVTFPMFEKISVLGETMHPLYQELIAAKPETTGDSEEFRQGIAGFLASSNLPLQSTKPEVFWNFEKFLVGRDGKVLDRFSSTIEPSDERLVGAVEAALAA